ncbi:hypothetical protein BC828DRAFT_385080 [Blastocladiella britannica]|nr:hypothetical protein BC828DRAFT_385080 [Blastocladiella britannica]
MYTSSAQFALPTPAPTPNHFGSNSSSGPASPSSTPTAQTPTGTGSQAASASPTPRTSPTPAPTVTTTGSFTPTTTATSVSAAATITTTSSRPPIAPGEHTCANCGISHSPLWRRTPDRAQVLCNGILSPISCSCRRIINSFSFVACGLYLKTYKEPRPLRLRKRKVRGVYGAVLAALTAGENGAPRSSAPSTSPSLSPPPVAESTMSTATPIITTSTTTTTAAPLVSAPPATDIMQQLFGVNGSVPIALPSITSTTVAKRSYDLMAAEDAVDIHVDQATPAAKRARTSLSPLTLSTPSSSLWAQPLQVACTKCGSSSTSQWHHASPATASSSPSGATMATAGIDSDIPHSPPPSPPTPRGAFSLSSSAPSPSTVVVAALMCHACATTQTLACAADDADVAAAVGDLVLEAGGKDRVAAWIAQWERRLSIARRAASGFV